MKNISEITEQDIRLFFDAADSMLQAAERNKNAASRATTALQQAAAKHDKHMQDIRENVTTTLEKSASTTADEAARLLAQHFLSANAAADVAAARYEKAAENLGWKKWGWFLTAQLLTFALVAVLIVTLVPGLDEIDARRADLAQLKENVKNLPGQWIDCNVEGENRRCFRTDDSKRVVQLKDGSTWRVPWTE